MTMADRLDNMIDAAVNEANGLGVSMTAIYKMAATIGAYSTEPYLNHGERFITLRFSDGSSVDFSGDDV